jgi:hypothetical protein
LVVSCIVVWYSGSTYPGVPTSVFVDTWVSLLLKALDKPKSAILASNLTFNRMLEAFTSLWMTGGLQPLCRYSSPTNYQTAWCSGLLKHKTFNNCSCCKVPDCVFKGIPCADSRAIRSLCVQERHDPLRLLPRNN